MAAVYLRSAVNFIGRASWDSKFDFTLIASRYVRRHCGERILFCLVIHTVIVVKDHLVETTGADFSIFSVIDS